MNSRDVANTVFQASALDARCEQARDPATAGVRVMVAVRRSLIPGHAGGYPRASASPINYAGRVRSVGGFSGRMKRG